MTYQPPTTGYPYGQPYQPYAVRKTNTMAILALVFGFVFFPLGIYFGHRAKKEIAVTGEDGEGLATAGIIVGWIHAGIWGVAVAFMLVWLVFVILYFVFAVSLIGASASTAGTNALTFALSLL
ncbi:DUF4190 domain-containing protein [Fodinicola acaciae]|uniref:DUF4190 domain-containing protein n=1 Tax=Fodinicola acaciae TaxID=2681555 RepID=UPI0013D3CD42|nr:DUF4190 domain-containing protein [Fodinicola acaciae]